VAEFAVLDAEEDLVLGAGERLGLCVDVVGRPRLGSGPAAQARHEPLGGDAP
jgi:hypothetical protein